MGKRAGMPSADYQPEVDFLFGAGVGRCVSCHMAPTSTRGGWFTDTRGDGQSALVAGDAHSHVFDVLGFQDSQTTAVGGVHMPSACGVCHTEFRAYGTGTLPPPLP